MLNKIKDLFTQNIEIWCGNIFQTMLIFACVRITFFLELYFRITIPFEKIFIILSGFFYYDLLLIASLSIITFLPYCLLQHFVSRTNQVLVQLFLLLYAVLYACSAEYFCYTYRPLDQVVFAYTLQELITTITASTNVSNYSIIFTIVNILIWFISFWFRGRLQPSKRVAISIFILFLIAFTLFRYKKIVRKEKGYIKSNDFFMAVNQPSYSYIKITDFNKDDISISVLNIDKARIWWWAQHTNQDFEDTRFPFEHKNEYNDVLGTFFNKTSNGQTPNFVFIIVESLGRKLTTDNPNYSFTPFIDSIASQGLFWPNCLSSTERTFGVLPAIFASVPQGTNGFASRRELLPHHTSLLQEATNNGYTTSFFYGGSASFTGQNTFLKENKVTNIMQAVLDESAEDFIIKSNNHRWGLDDHEMIQQAIQQKKNATPFLDVYLTLSSHEPFQFKGIEEYERRVLNMCAQDKGEEAKIIRDNKNIYASFLYADEAIKKLLTYYKSRDDYKNTIFIITGDHRMGPVNNGKNVMRKYNVPLIIFSPLLKTNRQMKGVASHYDIAPSISAYLSKNYNHSFSSNTHYIGQELDTSTVFHCKKLQAFMRNNREVTEWIHDTLFLNKNELYIIKPNLDLQQIENNALQQQLQNELNLFQSLSIYTVTNNYLYKNKDKNWKNKQDIIILPQKEKYDSVFYKNLMWQHIDTTKDFIHLIESFSVESNTVRCQISFQIKSLDTTKALPNIIYTNANGTLCYTTPIKKLNDKSINTGEIETFTNNIEIPFNNGDEFKLYLRTRKESNFLIRNLDVRIYLEE